MNASEIHLIIVFALLAAVLVAFVREWFSPDVVVLAAVAVLLGASVLNAKEVLGVFTNSAPLTIACMFIMSAALERTGCIEAMGRMAGRVMGRSISGMIAGMLLIVVPLSAFINNTPVVIMFTPVMIALAQSRHISPSKLLIPLSYATIFGGVCTLIGTSTNILVDGVARQHGLAPFGMFEISLAGMLMALIGGAYLVATGARWLPDRQTLAGVFSDRPRRRFFAEVLVPSQSRLVGKTLAQTGLLRGDEVRIIDVLRADRSLAAELHHLRLQAGDRVLMKTNAREVMGLRDAGHVEFDANSDTGFERISTRSSVVMEGIVGPHSPFSGRRLADLELARRYGVYVLAVHRQDSNLVENLDLLQITYGDVLLLDGDPSSLKRLFDEGGLINLSGAQERPFRRNKAPIVLLSMAALMTLAALNVLPIETLAIIAVAIVMLTRCVDVEEAYRAIDLRILIMIYGMLAFSVAMDKTGAIITLVNQLSRFTVDFAPWMMLSIVYAFTSLLTEVISNNAVAVLMTPVAIGIAVKLGVDPRPFVVAVMFAASASFATPIGYQTNTFVYNAGGYRFVDFLKMGIPLNVILWIAATVIIPLLWPLK